MSRALPPLFTCIVCGLPVRPQDLSAERKAVVWLKSKGSSIARVVEELHEYKHSSCRDEKDTGGIQNALF